MVDPSIDSFYYQIPVILKIKGDSIQELEFNKKYKDFEQVLKQRFDYAEKLEYFDDYGEYTEIIDQNSYLEAMRCTNGQAHYMRLKDAVKKVVLESPPPPRPTWSCTFCLFQMNSLKYTVCETCRKPRNNS